MSVRYTGGTGTGVVPEYKVVMLGAAGAGKTSLGEACQRGRSLGATTTTVGCAYFAIKSGNVRLHVWDTAGEERYKSLAPMYYRDANAAIVVVDVTLRASLAIAENWISELRNAAVSPAVHVVATKCDVDPALRAVSVAECAALAQRCGAAIHETSALTGQGVAEAFASVAASVQGGAARPAKLDLNAPARDVDDGVAAPSSWCGLFSMLRRRPTPGAV